MRQLAAVLLRQRLMRSWRRLAAAVKTQLKDAFLQAVVNDPKYARPRANGAGEVTAGVAHP